MYVARVAGHEHPGLTTVNARSPTLLWTLVDSMKRVACSSRISLPLRRAAFSSASHCIAPARGFSSTTNACKGEDVMNGGGVGGGGRRGGVGRRARNFRLEAIKKEGLPHLEQTAEEAAAKAAAKPLFITAEEMGPNKRQMKEASRMHQVLDDAIEQHSKKEATFTIRGDPIMILDVEVSQDFRHARAYWTTPLTLIDLPDDTRAEVKRRMQTIFIEEGWCAPGDGAFQAEILLPSEGEICAS